MLDIETSCMLHWGPYTMHSRVQDPFWSALLGAFAKLRKTTVSFVMSVRPRGTTRLPLDEFFVKYDTWAFFENLLGKFKFRSNLTRITGTLHEDVFTFMTMSRWLLLRMRNVSNKVVEKIKTHILCSVTFFRKSCRLWDNVEKCCGAREALGNMAHARCVLD
jgi:hypothetical protein